MSAAILFALPTVAQSASPATMAQGANVAGSQHVTFNNGSVRMIAGERAETRKQSLT